MCAPGVTCGMSSTLFVYLYLHVVVVYVFDMAHDVTMCDFAAYVVCMLYVVSCMLYVVFVFDEHLCCVCCYNAAHHVTVCYPDALGHVWHLVSCVCI